MLPYSFARPTASITLSFSRFLCRGMPGFKTYVMLRLRHFLCLGSEAITSYAFSKTTVKLFASGIDLWRKSCASRAAVRTLTTADRRWQVRSCVHLTDAMLPRVTRP